jgi:hypothetical protein
MKARVPKEYQNLSPQQKERLKKYLTDVVTEVTKKQEEHDCRVILELYLKMVCCVLHDAFGFGEDRLTCFIGNHKRLFVTQNKLVDKGEQIEYLNGRMAEIFKKNGFPQDFLDSLIGEIVLKDEDPEE